jgi:hypothetical protein
MKAEKMQAGIKKWWPILKIIEANKQKMEAHIKRWRPM